MSSERDYLSRAGSLEWRIFSDDRNRTWAFVFGGANDRINPKNGVVVDAPPNTLDFLVGVTQALSATAIVQSNLTYSRGHGYYSDPTRRSIRGRRTERCSHGSPGTTSISRAPTPPFASPIVICTTRSDRSPTRSRPRGSSRFPKAGASHRAFVTTANRSGFLLQPAISGRLCRRAELHGRYAPLGVRRVTPALTIAKSLPEGWSAELKLAFYRQRAGWEFAGDGSPGLLPFSARWIQAGIAKTF